MENTVEYLILEGAVVKAGGVIFNFAGKAKLTCEYLNRITKLTKLNSTLIFT